MRFDRSVGRFVDEFPELRWSGPAALSLSFSQFEAVWRTVSGKRTLVLGLDSIAFYRGPYAPVDPLIHHALASALLPAWTGPGPAPLWWTVWRRDFRWWSSARSTPGSATPTSGSRPMGRTRRTSRPWPGGFAARSTRPATPTGARWQARGDGSR